LLKLLHRCNDPNPEEIGTPAFNQSRSHFDVDRSIHPLERFDRFNSLSEDLN
jgi:hypothetical protein